jgi:hypothetical protein
MTRSFYHDQARYTVGDCATINGLRRIRWQQWRLISGAYVLTRGAWLPTRSTRRDIIDAMAAQWPGDKVTVTVIPIALGWLVRVRGDDQATLGGQNLFTNEADALAYARRIAC